MTQDTRKDRRVKIVSLNVRYKSATVDEFIENHAHDVSRGGIYIKTGSPFPPGTLLKFEIRLSSDQAVITGVGRVVWKRDTVQGSGERPSGMGVKFIKIDDPSKTVIDKLVNSRADAGRAYESESETPGPEAPAPAVAASPAPRASNRIGKSTMLGIGQLPQTSARQPSGRPGSPSAPPRPSSSAGGMFPKSSNPEADAQPKQEQTVMKQAAELLEEALREAGGSMEDVGTNPLFAGSAIADAVAEKAGLDVKPISTVPPEGPSSAAEAARARAMVAGMSPAPVVKRADSDPPRTTRDTPVAKSERTPMRSAPPRASIRPSLSSAPPPPKKGGSGTMIVIGVVVAAAAAGFLFREQIFGGNEPAPAATVSAGQAATAAPSASASAEVPEPPASAAPAASASAAPGPSAGASAAKPGDSAAPLTSATPAATPRPTPHAVTAPVAHPAATAASPTAATPPSTPTTAAPSETTAPAATATPTATATSVTPSTTAAPAPKPKPTVKPADDNPY
jgi:uncharacterized protein (TIGR02266 family)